MIDPATIPADYEVQPIDPDDPTAKDRATCGTCGLSWDDGKVTSMTPAPSARCPFEAFHEEEPEGYYEPPEGFYPGTVFDPHSDTFGPIMAAIQAGNFEEAAERLAALAEATD